MESIEVVPVKAGRMKDEGMDVVEEEESVPNGSQASLDGHEGSNSKSVSPGWPVLDIDWFYLVWAVTLGAGCILAIILAAVKVFGDVSADFASDLEHTWWSMFSVFALSPMILGLYSFQWLHRRKVQVVLYTIEPLIAKGWETPRKILELERKRLYWPQGEFKDLPLGEVEVKFPIRVDRRVNRSTPFYKVKLRHTDWMRLCDRITRQLECLNKDAYISGVSIKQSFFWIVVRLGKDRNPVVAMIREALLDAINHLEMDWWKLLDEKESFADCKRSVRRSDGEWIGACGGRNCLNQQHVDAARVYRLFRGYELLDSHTGRIPGALETPGPNERMLLGFVDLHSTSALNFKGAPKPVWKLHKWENLL